MKLMLFLQICLHELMERDSSWQYFLNTAGTELPLVPYSAFEEMASRAAGENVMESYRLPPPFYTRVNRYYHLQRFLRHPIICGF